MGAQRQGKLVMSWMVGDRTGETDRVFINGLAGPLASRVLPTATGHTSGQFRRLLAMT
jgi:hypothetical protein